MRRLMACTVVSVLLFGGCTQLKSLHRPQSSQPAPEAQASPASLPSGRGTPAEARAMTEKAIEHYNTVGRDKALADFTAMKSPFGDRDLYVVCIGSNRKITANGGFAQYVGASADLLKDAEGNSLGKAILDAAANRDGTVKYRWTNPVSHVTEPKIAYFKKVGEDVCGVGAYNPE